MTAATDPRSSIIMPTMAILVPPLALPGGKAPAPISRSFLFCLGFYLGHICFYFSTCTSSPISMVALIGFWRTSKYSSFSAWLRGAKSVT